MAAAVIILSVFAVTALLYGFGVFEYLEQKTYDLRVRLLADSARPSDDIIIILLNQDSIDWAYTQRGWSWPWPRKAYAELVDYMNLSGAASVAFDVIFSEPSLYGPEDDAEFARASRDYGKVVQTVFFSTQSGSVSRWPGDLDVPLFNPAGLGGLLSRYILAAGDSDRQMGAQFPIPELLSGAGAVGNITGRPDSDGLFRRTPLFAYFDGKAVPGLSAASMLAAGESEDIQYIPEKRVILWGDYTIPVDENGASLLRFRSSLDRYIPLSAGDVLQSAEDLKAGREPLLIPEDFEGKYIFFGYYAPGLFDICSTPVSAVYPGVGIHITMLDNILQQDFIRTVPHWITLVFVLAAVVLLTAAVLFSGRIAAAVGVLGGMLVVIGGASFAAYAGGFWLPMVAPLAGTVFAFLASTLYSYSTEGSQKRFIKSAFSQYLSPAVIDRLLADPERLTLGGERREISIYFSDVQGFTTISEKLDPSKLTELLNNYLSFMSDIILESGGTIDKYEGDAIIAFWNAPVDLEDHAARALGAALDCQHKLEERQADFEARYGSRLITRIGLNTGYAVVGNMGSAKRFDYTMLGDSVNLAARLEGLNKQFGTYTMCTQATMDKANLQGTYFGRELAKVAVVGKKEPVAVYEPMTEEDYRRLQPVLEEFSAARILFYEGKFSEALPRFEKLAETDKPSYFYAEQCRYYLKNPGEWQGFWKATSK
ncbi:adenylate/guanylate cyclase domain-containing protein [Breznakiella homolactica]|uniref:Adenylate/guanylate cyclase domain-containing protein n=2 Tax=Breznakiella homolactica TaxID=2798577 RepID=A0A7T8BB08_9SPIR|nr:adenylate/guanylate cyclase domain-containing protein [Breznakiella homolactica]